MPVPENRFWNVRLVHVEDLEYIAFKRRMADRRPSRGGPRAAGEVLGGVVERCVQLWLSKYVSLQEERILTYEQRNEYNGRTSTLYRELDGVWRIDDVSLCLFEIKMTYKEKMEDGIGLKQLETAEEILYSSGKFQYILKRMVYISEERVVVLDDLPALEPDDENSELGVVWVPPSEVVAAAKELELELPENWLEPESREGSVEDPEREEWKQFANSESETTANPLADALKKVMERE